MTYSVLVVDMFKAPLKESKHTVGGFATLELAREYARRRTWGSGEEQRRRHVAGADEIKRRCYQFGKNCSVVDDVNGNPKLTHLILKRQSEIDPLRWCGQSLWVARFGGHLRFHPRQLCVCL